MKWIIYCFIALMVCIPESLYSQNEIVAAEYFVDVDPGVGLGIPVAITSGTEIQEEFDVEIEDFSPGLHSISVRCMDENNSWSLFARKVFWVLNNSDSQIVEAEYYIDSDPGVGNAINIDVEDGMEVSHTESLVIDDLDEGLHCLVIRARSAEGNWGLYSKQQFYVLNINSPHLITGLEYFIDEDPGVGNGTMLSIDQTAELDETLIIDIALDLSEGDHILYVRVQQDDEDWSLYARHSFTVDNTIHVNERSNQILLYPNPSTGIVNVQSEDLQIESIVVFDSMGRKVMVLSNPSQTLDFSKLTSGEYIIQLIGEFGTRSRLISIVD